MFSPNKVKDLHMQFLKRNDSGIWVITATTGEFAHPSANICYTGIGKVNAAIAIQKLIDIEKHKLIINLSTAGSSVFDFGEIVNCTGFVQRDMNTTEFLAPKYVVPMSDDAQVLEYGARDNNYPSAICGSGDTFVRNIVEDIWNVVDMESFAYAYACRAEGIEFKCYKFISDGKGENTADHEWTDVLDQANKALNELYEKMMK
ncbi:5'-nucleosidase [Bacteroidia bacterium]|nr:5'-nucleosidase [Bacteroidia bacterium]